MEAKQPAATHRLQRSLPKLGIRPTIDGRYGGVREGLEGTVMAMAHSAAAFLSANVTHACGLPLECVISDTCIGGAAEAARSSEKFARENVGAVLTVTPCWCYGSETIDMDTHLPKAIWGFNGTERPGAVYLAAALAGHNQKGLPAFGIYGRDVQDSGDTQVPADVQARLLQFARSAIATASMKGHSYLAMGSVSMGIAGSIVNAGFFEKYLGMRSESVDMVEFLRRINNGIYDHAEYERALAWTKVHCPEGMDPNPEESRRTRAQKDADWEFSVKMALIARDLMVGNPVLRRMGYIEESEGHNAIAGGFQGQRQWTDTFPNGDFLEAILNSSFDWDGARQPYIVATENDSLNAVSMLFGHLLTGTAQLFADVRTYWSPSAVKRVTGHALTGVAADGIIHLINSGPSALDWTGMQSQDGKPVLKPFSDITPDEIASCLKATTWCSGISEYFRGGGWSTDFLTLGGMPVTMCRLNLVEGLGPVLQIAEGYTVDLPDGVHNVLDARTNPTWPTTWFVPVVTGTGAFKDVYSVMAHWGANHGAICYGHIGGDLITLASMLRIPVEMHNVPEDRLMRPTAWMRFGSMDGQAADYLACQAFGPLYK